MIMPPFRIAVKKKFVGDFLEYKKKILDVQNSHVENCWTLRTKPSPTQQGWTLSRVSPG